jgi:hypothetical protein
MTPLMSPSIGSAIGSASVLVMVCPFGSGIVGTKRIGVCRRELFGNFVAFRPVEATQRAVKGAGASLRDALRELERTSDERVFIRFQAMPGGR